jgi:hypothetical protein
MIDGWQGWHKTQSGGEGVGTKIIGCLIEDLLESCKFVQIHNICVDIKITISN